MPQKLITMDLIYQNISLFKLIFHMMEQVKQILANLKSIILNKKENLNKVKNFPRIKNKLNLKSQETKMIENLNLQFQKMVLNM